MSKRLSYDFVKSEIEKAGYKLLSSSYEGSNSILEISCKENHKYSISWSQFRRGKGCLVCSGLKHDIDVVRNNIQKAGYKLLSNKYINSKTVLDTLCPRGHLYKVCWGNFQNNYRCSICKGTRWSIEKVDKEFRARGYQLLSKDYKGYDSSLKAICNKGHQISISLRSLMNSRTICHVCSRLNRRHSHDFVKETIENAGYTLCSKEYINIRTRLTIKCDKGHLYKVRFDSFQAGNRCIKCSRCGFDVDLPGSLYYLRIKIGNDIFYKIGVTSVSIDKRLKQIPFPTKILSVDSYLFGFMALEKEQAILKKYDRFRYKGNDFKFGGYTELFTRDVLNKDVGIIKP